MARKFFDYHYGTQTTLNVLKIQREKLILDSCELHNSTIYNGLHEFEDDLRKDLYLQLYLINWLDSHWIILNKIIENDNEHRITAKKQMLFFFAKYFSEMIAECKRSGQLSCIAIPEILEMKTQTLRHIIMTSERWEEQNEILKADLKKHKEKFKKLLNKKQDK